MAFIYGPNGEYQGHTSDIGPQHYEEAKILFLIIVFGGGGWLLWNFLSSWQTLPNPYRFVAAYYYFLIIVPLKSFALVWQFASNLTSYPNLNVVIGGVAVFLYGVIGMPILAATFIMLLRVLSLQRYWSTILLAPAALSIIWLFGSGVIWWLFAK